MKTQIFMAKLTFIFTLIFTLSALAGEGDNKVSPDVCVQQLVLSGTPRNFAEAQNGAQRAHWTHERHVNVESKDGIERLKFTKPNRDYFRLQRENLRRAWEILSKEQIEGEHAITRLLEARMLGTHAIFTGGPGSGKSKIARMIQAMNVAYPDGTFGPDVFSLQMNQLTGDAVIRGFYDPEQAEKVQIERDRLKNNAVDPSAADSKREISAAHVFNKGTIVHFANAFIDEIDKGNPAALAALLDILNEKVAQYGGITLKVRTESIVFTSNMTLGELVYAFDAVGMRTNALALLDRIPFKVELPNKITDPSKEIDLMLLGTASRRRKASERLQHPMAAFESKDAQATVVNSSLPPIHLLWLGDLFEFGFEFDRDTLAILGKIKDEVELGFNDLAIRSEQDAAQSAQAGIKKSVFHPPTLFSNRWIAEIMAPSIKISLALQLLLLPEETLPTEHLIKLLERQTYLSIFSLWRLQDAALTASVGDAKLKFERSSGAVAPVATLDYGPETEKLKARQSSSRDREGIEFILEQRAIFKRALERALQENQTSVHQVGETAAILGELLGMDFSKSGSPRLSDLEEFIYTHLKTSP